MGTIEDALNKAWAEFTSVDDHDSKVLIIEYDESGLIIEYRSNTERYEMESYPSNVVAWGDRMDFCNISMMAFFELYLQSYDIAMATIPLYRCKMKRIFITWYDEDDLGYDIEDGTKTYYEIGKTCP